MFKNIVERWVNTVDLVVVYLVFSGISRSNSSISVGVSGSGSSGYQISNTTEWIIE